MLKTIPWSPDRTYRSGGSHEPIEFFLHGLINSKRLDLLLGYFSSSAINVLSVGFATFIYNGGTMRLVINNILSKEDKDAIEAGLNLNIEPSILDLSNIKELRTKLNEYGLHFFECLAWLIANKRIEIIIIRPKVGAGISHYKNGIFYDNLNNVGFQSSCNFTAFGLLENLERLIAFLNWEQEPSTIYIDGIKSEFDEIYSGEAKHVEYLNIHDVQITIVEEFGNKELVELLKTEKELLSKQKHSTGNKKLEKLIVKITERLDIIENEPRFPYGGVPREYQNDAYKEWCKNDYHGIFAMATGTGKTITSLNCILNEARKNIEPIYHALILVPTITLVNQWEEEASKFNFKNIIKVSSKTDWESELATTLSTVKRIDKSFIVVTTYASFVKNRFFNYLKDFPIDSILIADEAHNIGSPTVTARLPQVIFSKKIGLSATPKRVYDPEGSYAMESFFNDAEPYTYAFTMQRAIEEGILCKYYYYPHIVSLTTKEFKQYVEISKALAKFYNRTTDNFDTSDIVEKLLLKRKRIIHKAENKLGITLNILKERFASQGNLKYSFIYVPEGSTKEQIEEENELEDDIKIINQYTREIGKINPSILVNQFTGGMQGRDRILDQFKEGKIQVLASMKCLDEGVDIPRAEFAIFCSSTGNPRQFIQRRGRILRKHKDKNIAVIHDLVVIPDLDQSSKLSETYQLESKMVEKELERVMYFASLSINPFHTEEVFNDVCNHYNLNIYTIYNKL